jgi:hypothetical protein
MYACLYVHKHTHTHALLTFSLHIQWKGGFDLEARNAAESDAELETLQVCVYICIYALTHKCTSVNDMRKAFGAFLAIGFTGFSREYTDKQIALKWIHSVLTAASLFVPSVQHELKDLRRRSDKVDEWLAHLVTSLQKTHVSLVRFCMCVYVYIYTHTY